MDVYVVTAAAAAAAAAAEAEAEAAEVVPTAQTGGAALTAAPIRCLRDGDLAARSSSGGFRVQSLFEPTKQANRLG